MDDPALNAASSQQRATPAPSSMARIPLRTELLAMRLGVGPLARPKPCHGYQNGCTCGECTPRAKRKKPGAQPAQPWELRKAA